MLAVTADPDMYKMLNPACFMIFALRASYTPGTRTVLSTLSTFLKSLPAPIYAPIELIGHLARIFTLAIRLLANMFADHTVVGVWLMLVPVVVPAIFMGLGVLVAVLQAYVFTLLSMIYIGLALEEAH